MTSTFLQCVSCRRFVRFDQRPIPMPNLKTFLCWECDEAHKRSMERELADFLRKFETSPAPDLADLDID
jgi:hypothetical protein